MPERAVVLLSGGLDSATVLAEALKSGLECHALTVAYGQRHGIEIERAREIARRLGAASHRVVSLDPGILGGSALTDAAIAVPKGRTEEHLGRGIPVTYVPARNTVFLALALAWAETLGARDLFLGVNAVDYSGYPDCRPEYLHAFERLAGLATRAGVGGSGFRIHAPVLHWSKADIVKRAIELGVDVGRTLSCYDPEPDGTACGGCDACRLRERGFRQAGEIDPAPRRS